MALSTAWCAIRTIFSCLKRTLLSTYFLIELKPLELHDDGLQPGHEVLVALAPRVPAEFELVTVCRVI